MFKPSQEKFPISARIDEEMRYCDKCKTHLSFWHEIASKDSLGSYRIIKKNNRLQHACLKCGRWTNFDYSGKLNLAISSFKRHNWINCKKELFSSYPKHVARHLYKFLRELRYEETISFSWQQQFIPQEIRVLELKFSELESSYECVDNFRAADKSKKKQVRRYYKQKSQGCCGSFDDIYTHNGKTYLIGFNYGH